MTPASLVAASPTVGPDERPEPWWKTGVIYHIYPRSFADASGDGIGDLRGICDRLDHLNDGTSRSLGVSAIWLSPIYRSPGRDGGYDVAEHTAIDPAYGDLADFDHLVEECRRRGIRVILDLVLNHTSDLHPWFSDARSSKGSARRDWYIWRTPRRGGRPPNNWRSFFGGPAWTLDEHTGDCYLHTFGSEQPDLNWQNPSVRAAALEILRFWLARGVSGFRLDVFNAYFKHPDLPSNPWRPGRDPWSRQRHIYNKDRPELHAFLAELRELLDQHPGVIAIGETFDGNPELAASYCDTLHTAFNFDFLQQPWHPRAIQRSIQRWDGLLASDRTWPSYVLSNHDNPRHAWRHGRGLPRWESDARAKVAATLLLTLRGTPFVYYGEEIGMGDGQIPAAERDDIRYLRDPARTPMQWSEAPHAGFSDGHPWLRLADDARERHVQEQDSDPRSILNAYRRLIALRHRSLPLQLGDWKPLVAAPRSALAYLRTHGEQSALIVLNFGDATTRLRLDDPPSARAWVPRFSTRRTDIGWTVILGREITLGPYEATVFEAAPVER